MEKSFQTYTYIYKKQAGVRGNCQRVTRGVRMRKKAKITHTPRFT